MFSFIWKIIFVSTLYSFTLEARKFNLTDWRQYKTSFGLIFKSDEEERKRNNIFEDNLKFINKVNRENRGYKLGVNQFAHFTHKEFKNLFLGPSIEMKRQKLYTTYEGSRKELNDLDSFDWRKRGVVSKVKNQGLCASCWAFGAIGSLESAVAIKTGKLYDLSPQHLVDCAQQSNGCNGGLYETGWNYVIDHGIQDLTSYPYVKKKQECKYDKEKVVANMKDYVQLPKNENSLVETIKNIGPVTNRLDASSRGFKFLKSGVFYSEKCSKHSSNHVMISIGYGNKGSKPYFLFKNSWGTFWGEKGFGKIARNGNNTCGIVSSMGYPIV